MNGDRDDTIADFDHIRSVAEESAADPEEISAALSVALAASFGDIETWRAAWLAECLVHAESDGWVVLEWSSDTAALAHRWYGVDAESRPPPPGHRPLLARETGRQTVATDVDGLTAHIAWSRVAERLHAAVYRASASLSADANDVAGSVLIDVRRREAFERSSESIAGADWRDPARIDEWAEALVTDRGVIACCVAGHEVSRMVALRLRAKGIDARFLSGGLEHWKALGRSVVARAAVP